MDEFKNVDKLDQLKKLKCDYDSILDTIKEYENTIQNLAKTVETIATDIDLFEIAAANNKIKRLHPDYLNILENICHVCKMQSYNEGFFTTRYKCPYKHIWNFKFYNTGYVRVGYKLIEPDNEITYDYDECDVI
jgi:hypothetical protein